MTTADLIKRVESASGKMTGAELGECIRLSPWYDTHDSNDPLWTDFVRALQDGSLDAAVSLCARVKPGWGYVIRKDDEGHNAFLLFPNAMHVTPGVSQHETSPALALVLAILRAAHG